VGGRADITPKNVGYRYLVMRRAQKGEKQSLLSYEGKVMRVVRYLPIILLARQFRPGTDSGGRRRRGSRAAGSRQ
jgi:hypothetical protein